MFCLSDDYFRMKLQWKTISDEQKLKFTLMKERENLIGNARQFLVFYFFFIWYLIFSIKFTEKDVQRTDRTHAYFEGDENPNLVTMKDILMTYNMLNFDLGKHIWFTFEKIITHESINWIL